MSQLDLALALAGGLVLALSLGLCVLRSSGYLPSEPLIAVAFGVAVGPAGLDLLGLTPWGDPLVVLEEVARLTIALAVTSIALRLPTDYYRRRARSLAVVLGPVMVGMWLASSLVTYLVLSVPPLVALLVHGMTATPLILRYGRLEGGSGLASILDGRLKAD